MAQLDLPRQKFKDNQILISPYPFQIMSNLFFTYIRGQGLAYGAYMGGSASGGSIYFSLYR